MSRILSDECPIARMARIAPEAEALVDGGVTHDYGSFHAAITARASGLAVTAGTRIGIYAPPSFAYLCLLFAAWRKGCVVFPLSTRLPEAGLTAVLHDVGGSQLFTEGTEGAIEGLELSDVDGACDASYRSETPASRPPESSQEQVVPIDLQAPALVLQTSGTTAAGKNVVHSIASLGYNALGANENMPLVAGDRWLLSLPLYHVSGMGIVMRAVLSGTCVVIDAVSGLDDAVRDHGISHVSVVHTQLDRLVTACEAGRPLPGLKAVLAGGSSIPGDLVSRALAVGLPLHLSYGSTEMGSQVSTSLSADIAEGISHSGAVLRYREVKISAAGEILVRGEALCQGYLDGGRIRPCTDAEGWFQTGDRGTFTAEGKLCVTGRCDSMFISGGENIYPEEIEAALLALPGVVAAGVVDVPDDTYGARPVAVIKLQGGAALDEAAIRDMLRERLPGFKVPARVLPWPDDYPTGGLKLDRAHLRRYVAAAGG